MEKAKYRLRRVSQVKWDLLPQLFRAQLLLTRALRNLQTPPAGVSSLYRPKLACQCRVWGLHPRPAPPTQGRATFCGHRLTWGIVKSASRAAPGARAPHSLPFHALATRASCPAETRPPEGRLWGRSCSCSSRAAAVTTPWVPAAPLGAMPRGARG